MRKIITLILLAVISFGAVSQSPSDQINLLILKQKYKEALKLSNGLISNYPDSAYYLFQNALVNKLMYHYSEALESIEKATGLLPNNVDFLVEYGIILEKKEKDNEAFQVFKEVLEKDDCNLYAGIWVSNHYMKKRKFDEALGILNGLYKNDSTNNYIARNVGLCWYKKGDYENSKKWFKKSIQLDSTDIKSYRYLFSTYAGKEEFELAHQTIDKAIIVEPNNMQLYTSKGDLHVVQNHHFQAVKVYNKAFSINPKDTDVTRKLGLSYYKIKEYDKAKYYLLLSDKGEMNLEVYKHLGSIYKIENKPDSSTYYYTRALSILRPDYNTIFNIYNNIAENYFSLGYYEHTIGWYEQALKLNVTGIWTVSMKNEMLINLASVYSDKMDNKQKAIECLERVTNDSKMFFNKEDYYTYAQKEITRLKEELFFEGKL